jgi:Amt family ammonium transporter
MFRPGRSIKLWLGLFFLWMSVHAACALTSGASPTSDPQAERIAKLEQSVADAKSSADNSWMLTSSALVLMMTGPGLALFYGGLVRKKNVLSTMMQSFAMMAIVTVVWAIIGYSLSFGEGNSFTCTMYSCGGSGCNPTLTTPEPSRSRPSWSIS